MFAVFSLRQQPVITSLSDPLLLLDVNDPAMWGCEERYTVCIIFWKSFSVSQGGVLVML